MMLSDIQASIRQDQGSIKAAMVIFVWIFPEAHVTAGQIQWLQIIEISHLSGS